MSIAVLLPLSIVIICSVILCGCYLAFDRLQTRIEATQGGQRWLAIVLAAAVGLIALFSFWCCFTFSAGLLQSLGLNL